MVKFLMEDTRLEINSKDNDGRTHFDCKQSKAYTKSNGHLEIVEFLIKDTQSASLGLDINSKDHYKRLLFIKFVNMEFMI